MTAELVERICKNIVIHKAPSVPYLSSRVLKDGFLAIIPQLTHMFNISLGKGIFPEKWKRATVIQSNLVTTYPVYNVFTHTTYKFQSPEFP